MKPSTGEEGTQTPMAPMKSSRPIRATTSRTTGSDAPTCRQCSGPIRGRRRNGFCSDACRMRNRRADERLRLAQLVVNVELAVAAVRQAVMGDEVSAKQVGGGGRDG